jgi:hypothetical protein
MITSASESFLAGRPHRTVLKLWTHRIKPIPFTPAPVRARNYPADSQTKRATNSVESTSNSQSVRVILPRSSLSSA